MKCTMQDCDEFGTNKILIYHGFFGIHTKLVLMCDKHYEEENNRYTPSMQDLEQKK